MDLRDALLELLADHGHRPGRSLRLAVDDLLAVVADANPDLPAPDAGADDDDDQPGLAVRSVACPHCGEPVVVELELDGGTQAAIHDCSVCCRPIALAWDVRDGGLDRLDVAPG